MKVTVRVHPNAKKPRVEKKSGHDFDIYVSQPPVEDKANQAVIKSLAEHLGVAKSKISLLYGAKSKTKVFFINQ